MRKPVYLAVVGISIVVAAGSLGVILTRYLGLRAYFPKGTAQAAATPPAEWNNLFAPKDGMRLASRLPAMDGKSGSRRRAPRSFSWERSHPPLPRRAGRSSGRTG